MRLESKVPAFKDLANGIDNNDFATWIKSPAPEANVPQLWEDGSGDLNDTTKTVYKLLIIQVSHIVVNR